MIDHLHGLGIVWQRFCINPKAFCCVLIVEFLPNDRISSTTLASHPLVAASLAGLSSDETFDAAVDGTPPL